MADRGSRSLKDLEEATKPIKIHIKADSGMGRIGFLTPEEVKELQQSLMIHQI